MFKPPAIQPPEKTLPLFKRLFTLADNPIEAWPRAVYEEDFYWAPSPYGPKLLFVTKPEAIREILLDRGEDFSKGSIFLRFLKPALGEAMLTAEGAHWRWQRQAAAPAFRPDTMAKLTPIMSAAAEKMLARWRAAGVGAQVDVAQDMVRITFDIILDTMLSGGEGIDIEETSREISIYLETLGRPSIGDILGLPPSLKKLMSPRGVRAANYLRSVVQQMVARRRSGPSGRGDLVDLLMQAKDPETGRAMSDMELRDNLITFIGAGHETTALALTWSLYLLSQDSVTAQRVRAEVQSVTGDASITQAHVETLSFTRQVVLEAMRLFPPVAALPRQASRDTTILGMPVPKNTIILMPIYAMHRHSKQWDRPDVFDPDRFAPDLGLERQRYHYMPFGAGHRICIGLGFALNEAVAVLATLMREVQLDHNPAHKIRPLVRITMRPEGGMPMRIAALMSRSVD
ncbi:cytochrome P450 [Candidatus Phycosocius spiralis]|nr:cytochrome P450 [Candidatus Phycosocius spiralis]